MITCNRKALISALDRCAKVTAGKPLNPILTHALVSFAGDALTYRATSTALTVAGSLEAAGDDAAFAINPRDALNALGRLESETVKISPGAGFVQLYGEKKRSFKVPTLDAEDFPKAPECAGKQTKIAAATLLAVIRGVAFAMAGDNEDRDHLKVARLVGDGKLLTGYATDGRSCAKCAQPFAGKLEALIPAGACRHLLDSAEGEVTITEGNVLGFAWGDSVLYATLPIGEFPGVDPVFREPLANEAKVSAKELAASVAAVQSVDSERDVVLTFRPGLLTIEAHGKGHGYASDELEISCDCVPIQIGMKASRLCDALAVADDELVLRFTNDPDGFDVFRLESEGWAGAVMPLRPETLREKGKL